MKKYINFSISFIIAFILLEVVYGLFLTLTYTPDITETWNMGTTLSQETVIVGSHKSILPTIFIAFLSAAIAYFIPNKLIRTNNNVK